MNTEFKETDNIISVNWVLTNLVNIYQLQSMEYIPKHIKYCLAFLVLQHSPTYKCTASKNAEFQL